MLEEPCTWLEIQRSIVTLPAQFGRMSNVPSRSIVGLFASFVSVTTLVTWQAVRMARIALRIRVGSHEKSLIMAAKIPSRIKATPTGMNR